MTNLISLVETLVTAGGKEWISGDKHRVYFNDLKEMYCELIGVEFQRYGTGAIKSATMDGEKLSNNKCHKLLSSAAGKIHYDVKDNVFRGEGVSKEVLDAVSMHLRGLINVPKNI